MILRNSAKCLTCDTEIESVHRHDFKACQCGDLFVDGGKDYIRRGFKDASTFTDTSIIVPDDPEGTE